jgi:hypothetical protein
MRVVTSKSEWRNGVGKCDGWVVSTDSGEFCSFVNKMGKDRKHFPGFDRSFIVDDFDVTDDFAVIDMWFSEEA